MNEQVVPIGIIANRLSHGFIAAAQRRAIDTPFGPADVVVGSQGARAVVFIERYGPAMTRPSHKVNFRASIYALRTLGCRRVISQNAIGSLSRAIVPGDIVIPHDLIDHTKARPLSLFDEEECWVRVDMTSPFCPQLRTAMIRAGHAGAGRVVPQGVFVCTEGPRLETPAEVAQYRREGGDIIGTPMIPEAVFAREAEMCYASIAPVINLAAGLTDLVDHRQMNEFYASSGLQERAEAMIAFAVQSAPEGACACHSALRSSLHGRIPDWVWADSSVRR